MNFIRSVWIPRLRPTRFMVLTVFNRVWLAINDMEPGLSQNLMPISLQNSRAMMVPRHPVSKKTLFRYQSTYPLLNSRLWLGSSNGPLSSVLTFGVDWMISALKASWVANWVDSIVLWVVGSMSKWRPIWDDSAGSKSWRVLKIAVTSLLLKCQWFLHTFLGLRWLLQFSLVREFYEVLGLRGFFRYEWF